MLRRAHARHLRTDPACVHYAAPKLGSRLDAASRGLSCRQCMPVPIEAFVDGQPTPKMLRECANILETAPYQRTREAAWLRAVADA